MPSVGGYGGPTTAPVTAQAIRRAPKVLLHDHLDGGLRTSTILELADSIGWAPRLPSLDLDELQRWFTAGAEAGDLLQYLATFEHTLAVMQQPDHIERIAYEAAFDLALDGVVYAELRFAPELHDLPFDVTIDAVAAGFRRGEHDAAVRGHQIEVNAIICAMRTEQRSLEVAQFVDRVRGREPKVLAFDLAGAETGWPPSLHTDALAFARANHLNLTIHASEPPDLELISDALAHGAQRIGHGVRLVSDTSVAADGELIIGPLARFVLDHQIHLEMAPTCNTQIGAVPSVADHPIGPFLRRGFNVSVNTDNRLMSHVSPSSEMDAVATAFNLSWDEIATLVRNGVMSSFAPIERRRALVAEVIDPAYGALSGVSAAAG
jgi:adenosine deaminase